MPVQAQAGATRRDVRQPAPGWVFHPAVLFALIFACLLALHAPLLRLPYFWDEAGYYVPAARDLLLTGSLVPHSTATNPHPPLVMAWLALAWKLFSYSPLVTRTAMLLVAAFALLGVFRLARKVANTPVAVASTILTAIYPVFFAQSSMAHIDLAAAALIIWGLAYYLDHRLVPALIFFSLAALTKETAILAPLALFAWQALLLVGQIFGLALTIRECDPGRSPTERDRCESRDLVLSFLPVPRREWRATLSLLLPAIPLALWLIYQGHATGHLLGDPEFVRYNLLTTLNPTRIAAAIALRIWHLLGYLNLFALTATTALAMWLPPLADPVAARSKARGNGHPELLRRRIALPVQMVFAVLILAHVLALSVLGGAVLARYMLPVLPLVIILCVSTLRRRVPWWPAFVAVIGGAFVLALVTNPPYRFAPEDNLAYVDYVQLHQAADAFVASHYPNRRVLTAWPASDELTKPYLGYVDHALTIVRIEDFSAEQIMSAGQARQHFDVALLFSTKYEPGSRLADVLPFWERIQRRFFGFHRDLPPEVAAQMLGGHLVFRQSRAGQWVAVVAIDHVENAALRGKEHLAFSIWPRRAPAPQGRPIERPGTSLTV